MLYWCFNRLPSTSLTRTTYIYLSVLLFVYIISVFAIQFGWVRAATLRRVVEVTLKQLVFARGFASEAPHYVGIGRHRLAPAALCPTL